MAINYPEMLKLRDEGRFFSWNERDAMLYAVAIGLGQSPTDENELRFTCEARPLRVVPTFAAIISWDAIIDDHLLGIDLTRILHGEEDMVFHRSLPPAGTVTAESGIAAIYDKGVGRGAIIVKETILRSSEGEKVVTIRRTGFARGDGGFGGPAGGPAAGEPMPDRAPDEVIRLATRPEQALLYRLCADRNMLHADPVLAVEAGFPAPILHGLCTYGMTCRAVLQAFCAFDPALLKRHSVRFSAPVYPGDTIEVRLWRDGDEARFEAVVPGRNEVVIKNGRSELAAGA